MTGYELLDFGDGRKLESLCGYRIDRPSPAAAGVRPALPRHDWQAADATFCPQKQRWICRRDWPAPIGCEPGQGRYLQAARFRLPFGLKPFGHIGCFPEQQSNWSWLESEVARLTAAIRATEATRVGQATDVTEAAPAEPRGLNLFAHTGGSTWAMAVAGAQVTHVDAAKPSVQAARAIAVDNGLAAAPIRYLVEDAAKYVRRELKRRVEYDLVVLDPPSYGHGPGGKPWLIGRDLWPLIDHCLALLRNGRGSMLITGHGEQPDQRQIADYLRQQQAGRWPRVAHGRSSLIDRAGRRLDAGFFVRAVWT